MSSKKTTIEKSNRWIDEDVTVHIDSKGRLYVNPEELFASKAFRRNVAAAARVPIKGESNSS